MNSFTGREKEIGRSAGVCRWLPPGRRRSKEAEMDRTTLKSPLDGFEFAARLAPGAWTPRRGGLIVIQEIFGVTDHIRETAASYAEEGYEVIAPSLYDRRAPGFEAAYAAEDVGRARALSEATPWDEVAADLAACVAALRAPVFAVGYCWGGAAAWEMAAFAAWTGSPRPACYYGRRIPGICEAPRNARSSPTSDAGTPASQRRW